MNLDQILGLPRSGVVILKKGDSILVSYTTSMGSELQDLYSNFKGQSGITMEVLSCGVDLETLKLHTEYYRKHYSQEFKPLLKQGRKALQYKVRCVPNYDFKYVDVELVTARGDGKIVGRFKTNPEAKSFIETCYGSSNPFKLPVYALNSDTEEFLDGQKKMLQVR